VGTKLHRGRGGVKQSTAVAISTTRAFISAGDGWCSGEGFTAWNSSKQRGDEGASYPGSVVAWVDI
jgi:hypothetical protein